MSARVAMTLLGNLLSGSGPAAKLLILTYHRVLPRADWLLPDMPDATTFEWQMALLARDFTVLPLTEAVRHLIAGTLSARTVCITFDDGYADNASVALPILHRYGLTATFFIATGFLNGGRMWNDTVIESVRRVQGNELNLITMGLQNYFVGDMEGRRKTVQSLLRSLKHRSFDERLHMTEALAEQIGGTLPDDLMMSSEQVAKMYADGMEIGAHTVNHPILKQLNHEDAEWEIRESSARLRELGIDAVNAFAYPNGRPGIDYDHSHAQAVQRAGFKLAVSTTWGYVRRDSDPLQLPRIAPWGRTPARFRWQMLRTYLQGSRELAVS